MIPLKYIRDGQNIKYIENDRVERYPSINAAKRESRRLQIAEDGRTGAGSLMTAIKGDIVKKISQ